MTQQLETIHHPLAAMIVVGTGVAVISAQKSPADAARDAVVEWRTLQIDLLTARLGHAVLLIVTLL